MGHWGQATLRAATLSPRRWGQTTLRADDFEGRRLWGQATLRAGDIEGKFFNFSRIMSKNANFPTLGPKGPQKPPNLHIIPNVGSINPIKYVLSPNRNPQNCKFPNPGPEGPTETLKMYAEGLPPHFHFHNDRSLSSNTTIFLQNHDEAYHFLPRGWMSPELKICCNVFTLSLSQWPEIVFREKWLAPCVNLKQTSSSTDLCGRD